jgi:thioredoxin-related protein
VKKGILIIISALIQLYSLNAQDWQTNFTLARKNAIEQNKPIILVFQGSDWCAPCIKLDREIWSTAVFKAYSKEHYIMLKADFPRKKENKLSDAQVEANGKLAEAFNRRGIFPLVVVLDTTGNLLGETGYKKTTPEAYIQELNRFLK